MPGNIEDYGIIGDGQTVALVDRSGSIDWLCWPRFDSDACFAALLGDEHNGRWRISPADTSARISRRYRHDTLILETQFETDDGTVTLIDFMPQRGNASDIVRLVRCDSGSVKMQMDMTIRFGFGSYAPWVKRLGDGTLQAIAGPDMIVLRTPVEMHGEELSTVAEFTVDAGTTIPFVMTYGASHEDPPKAIDPDAALADTEAFWTEWTATCTYQGQYRDIIVRSLIVLKAMIYAPTGGIVAAPTTSLPEKLGGSRNWDYRFCWLRDATFTLLALMNSGYYDEASAWHTWLLRAVAGSPKEMQIMYGVTGERRLTEWEVDWLPGYQGAKPVRIGNAAHGQLQLDVYGELMDSFHQSRLAKLNLDKNTWQLQCMLLEHLETAWKEPDAGIWERRGRGEHYVSSKVMVWVAFDRGIKSAQMFGLEAPIDRWTRVRDEVHRDICEKGFDREQNSFVQSYGAKVLDASVLMIPMVGFLPATDPRVKGTLAAIEKYLMPDGFVMRHDPREKTHEQQPVEGSFLACTLLLSDAYILSGNIARAEELFEQVIGVANDLGLLAEEYDVPARRQTGNFPQALTHIALINTAHNLNVSQKPAIQRAAE